MFPTVETTTPAVEYEPRIWAGRIWVKGGSIAGIGFVFKAPYGVAMNASQLLTRASATRQIERYAFGPLSTKGFKKLDRSKLTRYEDAFERLSLQLGIDWSR
jgi:hypothetical protein